MSGDANTPNSRSNVRYSISSPTFLIACLQFHVDFSDTPLTRETRLATVSFDGLQYTLNICPVESKMENGHHVPGSDADNRSVQQSADVPALQSKAKPFLAATLNPADLTPADCPGRLCVNSYSCSVLTVPDNIGDADDIESLSSCGSMPGLEDIVDVNEWCVSTNSRKCFNFCAYVLIPSANSGGAYCGSTGFQRPRRAH